MEDCWRELKLDSANITIQGTPKKSKKVGKDPPSGRGFGLCTWSSSLWREEWL